MREKRSFASREWFEGQVRYGEWVKEQKKQNHYLIYSTVTEGTKRITVLIKIRDCQTYVLVEHAHVLGKKKA